jgi:hypothetical protein
MTRFERMLLVAAWIGVAALLTLSAVLWFHTLIAMQNESIQVIGGRGTSQKKNDQQNPVAAALAFCPNTRVKHPFMGMAVQPPNSR